MQNDPYTSLKHDEFIHYLLDGHLFAPDFELLEAHAPQHAVHSVVQPRVHMAQRLQGVRRGSGGGQVFF
jgi:hypothetical protein